MILEELLHFFILPIIIGILGGFAAYIFRILIRFFTSVYETLDLVHSIDLYLLSMPLVFWGSYQLIRTFLQDHGNVTIDEIAKKISLLSGRFSFVKGFLVLFLTSVSIGFGVPIGREGPIAKLGGLLSEVFLRTFKVQRVNLPIYLSAGVSSALAATFNAPIAGVIFGIEIIIGRINSYILIPLVVACATSTMIAREFIGDYTAFYVPPLHYTHDYFFYVPVAAVFFSLIAITINYSLKRFLKLRFKYRKHWSLVVVILGLVVACFIIMTPQIRGVGYEAVDQIFVAGYRPSEAFDIMASKLFAVILSIGSGIFGGLMSPSIFIGAFGGYWFGSEVMAWHSGIDPRVFALIGSAAMLAGISRAPLRSAVIITELTHSYQLLLPMLITSAITAYLLAKTQAGSYFKRSLLQKGIDIEDPGVVRFLERCDLKDYLDYVPAVSAEDPLKKTYKIFRRSHSSYLPVVDDSGRLVGVISLRDVRKSRLLHQRRFKVKELMSTQPFTIGENYTKEDIYKALSILNANHIPLVDAQGVYLGMVNLNRLLKAMTLHQQGYRIRRLTE